jgi:phage gp37-like protein
MNLNRIGRFGGVSNSAYGATDDMVAKRGGIFTFEDGQLVFTEGAGHETWFATASASVQTVTLPSADASVGTRFTVKRQSGSGHALNVVALSGNLDGTATHTIANQYDCFTFQSDGTNYNIVWGHAPLDLSELITSASLASALAPYLTSASASAAYLTSASAAAQYVTSASVAGMIASQAPSDWVKLFGSSIDHVTSISASGSWTAYAAFEVVATYQSSAAATNVLQARLLVSSDGGGSTLLSGVVGSATGGSAANVYCNHIRLVGNGSNFPHKLLLPESFEGSGASFLAAQTTLTANTAIINELTYRFVNSGVTKTMSAGYFLVYGLKG